jgi:putative copper resistance protein D
LVIGYLFAWTVIGIDPLPRPLPSLARLGLLLAAMPCDIVFGAALINTRTVIGNGPSAANMYSALALPWVPSPLTDQHTAGLIALAVGEVSLLLAIAALIARWHHLDHTANPDGHEGLLTALGQRNTAVTRRAGLDATTDGSAGPGSVTKQPR